MRMRRQMDPAGRHGSGHDDLKEGSPIRELDRVRVLHALTGDDEQCVPMGATGTVVGVYANGEAFEVEFTQPVDTLATIQRHALHLVERGRT